jgi:zinc protease
MNAFLRGIGALSLIAASAAYSIPALAQAAEQPSELVAVPPAPEPETPPTPPPQFLQTEETPWLYRGSDIPIDQEWLFGEMDNGLRYAVRNNGVPPGQVSIRVRVDVGSLHERDSEQGFAHLLEHLLFRESKYLGQAKAIETWQRLGATFGSDTNAETSPTHTAYKLDLPDIDRAKLYESFKLLSGMIREPVLSQENVDTEIPIVLAEKRERGGTNERVGDFTREVLFAGQRLATRAPIGTVETLSAATGNAVSEFHRRWYRPERTVIVVVGDADPIELAGLVEQWFGDWQGIGEPVAAPDFGDPVAPVDVEPDSAWPVGELGVTVEPDLPRTMTFAVLRPWRPVQDTIVYNEGLLLDAVAQAIINRRLESRARLGGSFLYAQVLQEDVSRSTDATFVSFAPLSTDWQAALADVRGVIADALATPPTPDEVNREVAEFETVFINRVEQSSVIAASEIADGLVGAVDIRETVASPETVLAVFQGMRERFTPEEVFVRTKQLFEGEVVRGIYVTPATGEADKDSFRTALSEQVAADEGARMAALDISFEDLPAIGPAGTIAQRGNIGLFQAASGDIEQINFANGVRVLLWPNDAEPGRVAVKARFGAGYRAFDSNTAPYATLGEMALVSAGLADLGQEEIDILATGRKLGFDFAIEDSVFSFFAQTRSSDLADQLYLFAAKLGMPRWDPDPINRARAAAELTYASYAASPNGVLTRDLEYLVRDRDIRFETPSPESLEGVTPERFREVWEPLLKQGPIEVLVFGEFDRASAVEALSKTFGALPTREPISLEVVARTLAFPTDREETEVRSHRGDADQAAAVIVWPSGAGIAGVRDSRQLEILTQVFNNRLFDAMRENAGASYAPQVISEWPLDLPTGGTIRAVTQLQPKDVPVFFAEAERIAQDLTMTPPTLEELERVTEPLLQLVRRASTGNLFWLYQLEGATRDPRRISSLRTLPQDYSQTTPAKMQQMAQNYFGREPGWRLAILPEGQTLASLPDYQADPLPQPKPAPVAAEGELVGR